MFELLTTIFALSLVVFVIGSMASMGLSLKMGQILEPLKNVRLVILALVANFVLVPIVATLVTLIFPLDEPLRIIAENAGVEGMVVVDEVRRHKDAVSAGRQGSYGYDAATGEYCDLFEHGIIDPAKVTRAALENAASIASLVLTTETLVTEIPEPPAAAPPGPPPMEY